MTLVVYEGASPARMMSNGKTARRGEPVEVTDEFAESIDGKGGFRIWTKDEEKPKSPRKGKEK